LLHTCVESARLQVVSCALSPCCETKQPKLVKITGYLDWFLSPFIALMPALNIHHVQIAHSEYLLCPQSKQGKINPISFEVIFALV